MTNEELQSKTIDFLRFPLIVGVVLIHAHLATNVLQESRFVVYDTVSYLISDVVARVAVPLFFFISGFLFFHRSGCFSLSTYVCKLKKRTHSILIPYLFWNLIVILLYFLAQTFLSGLMGETKLIIHYSVVDWLGAFWSVKGAPICYQFWFLRDLMVVIVFSPLIYLAIKYLNWFCILILGILWYFNWWFALSGFSIAALFFFSAGAYFGIRSCNFVVSLTPFFLPVTVIYVLLAFICVFFREQSWFRYIHSLSILVGIAFFITLSAHFLEWGKWSVNPFLVGCAFFIYAYHGMPLILIQKISLKSLPFLNDWILFTVYFLSTGLIILMGLFIYCLLKRRFPRFLRVMTGGR